MTSPYQAIPDSVVTCRTYDKRKKAVYHTNVMLCIGTDVSIVCAEGVTDAKERQRLLASLRAHQTVSPFALCNPLLYFRPTSHRSYID